MRAAVITRCANLHAFLLIGVLALGGRVARAEDEATIQARQCYQEAQKQFDLGNWEAAIAGFSKAYELRPDPIFLYDMAQAYRRGGNARRAIDLYKNYLIKVPKSPQREEIEDRIQALQKQVDEDARAGKRAAVVTPEPTSTENAVRLGDVPPPASPVEPPAAAPATAPASSGGTGTPPSAEVVPAAPSLSETQTEQAVAPPPVPPPALPVPGTAPPVLGEIAAAAPVGGGARGLRVAGVVVGALGAAATVGGVAFSLLTHSLSNSVGNAAQFNSSDARAGKRAQALQWVGYGAGAALLATGAVLYWKGLPPAPSRSRVSLVPALAPGSAGLAATGAF